MREILVVKKFCRFLSRRCGRGEFANNSNNKRGANHETPPISESPPRDLDGTLVGDERSTDTGNLFFFGVDFYLLLALVFPPLLPYLPMRGGL